MPYGLCQVITVKRNRRKTKGEQGMKEEASGYSLTEETQEVSYQVGDKRYKA